MQDLLGLSSSQLAAVGAGVGVFFAALVSAFRGFKAPPKEGRVVQVPKVAIPHELQEQIDDIENRCVHIERKADALLAHLQLVYTDTQVIRALTKP